MLQVQWKNFKGEYIHNSMYNYLYYRYGKLCEKTNILSTGIYYVRYNSCVLPNTKRVTGVRIEYARQRMGEVKK